MPNKIMRTCGTMQAHYRLMLTNPAYAKARALSNTYAFDFARTGAVALRAGITIIPVVVHVVYKTAEQNISDDQIKSQIAVLNKDFRKNNPDIGEVPSAFQALAADARIEFVLASNDSTGTATNGITRTQTTVDAWSPDDKVKYNASGGSDAWNPAEYLNIWVCQLGGGVLGYAQFPGGPTATDGVVILHSAFGTLGSAVAPFDLGRTATHEIGHWLNLKHIWGDDDHGCWGSDDVTDTPNCGGPNYGAPTFPNVSCGNGPNGDLYVNYMDYVDDTTMVMFTHGQVERMQACLDHDRPDLGTTKPSLSVKAIRDLQNVFTRPLVDFGTHAQADMGTGPGIDPLKVPGFDKPPGSDIGNVPLDPLTRAFGRFAPFVLATPHHAASAQMASGNGGQAQRLATLEQVLAAYARVAEQSQLSEEQERAVTQLRQEYVALLQR